MRGDWIITPIDKIGDIITGNTPSKSNSSFYLNKDFPFYKPTDLEAGNNVKLSSDGLSEEGFKNSRIAPEGSILVTCIGATIGKTGLIKNCGAFNQQINGIIPFKSIDSKFVYYQIIGLEFQQKIKEKASSTTLPILNKSKFSILEIKLAPLPIQRAIVLKIENLFASLDKGIADLKTAQEQLKVYRQAVLKKAFEGGFTNKNIKEGELPEGWKWVKLGEVAAVNPKLPNKEAINSILEVQFLPMKLVEEEVNKIHLVETKLFKEVQKGSYTPFIENDIIFAKVTPCMENGKIAITTNLKNGIGFVSSEFHVIRCKCEIFNSFIFYFVVQSRVRKEAENQMTGAVGLRRVPKKFLEDHLIPKPPSLIEQHAIVREIESRLSVCDKVEQSIVESLEKAEALKQSILKKAFEGCLLSAAEIAKCKQEADYEPASVLLEKIKTIKNK